MHANTHPSDSDSTDELLQNGSHFSIMNQDRHFMTVCCCE